MPDPKEQDVPAFRAWAGPAAQRPNVDIFRLMATYCRDVLGKRKGVPRPRRQELERAFREALCQAADDLGARWQEAEGPTRPPPKETDAPAKKDTDKGAEAWPTFDGKALYGDQGLRGRLPVKPAKEDGKALEVGLRPRGKGLRLAPDLKAVLATGGPGSMWLGLVQIAERTGVSEDVLWMIPYVPKRPAPGPAEAARLRLCPLMPTSAPADLAHAHVLAALFEGKRAPLKGLKLARDKWNGIEPAHLSAERAEEAGCFLGFAMVMGEAGAAPFVDFRCDINRYGNARFCDTVPAHLDRLTAAQRNAWNQYQFLLRYPAMVRPKHEQELAVALKGAVLKRGAVLKGSRRVPLDYARTIIEALKPALGGR